MGEEFASYHCEAEAGFLTPRNPDVLTQPADERSRQPSGRILWCKPNHDFPLPRLSVSLSSTNLTIKHPRLVPKAKSFLTFLESNKGKKGNTIIPTSVALCLGGDWDHMWPVKFSFLPTSP